MSKDNNLDNRLPWLRHNLPVSVNEETRTRKLIFTRFIKIAVLIGSLSLPGCSTDTQKHPQPGLKSHAYTSKERLDERFLIESHDINFDFDSALIPESGIAILDQVEAAILHHDPREILITGYTDSAGDKAYNQTLAAKRAHSVAAALEKRGIRSSLIKIGAMGEEDSAIPTRDGVKFLENRRVSIDLRR